MTISGLWAALEKPIVLRVKRVIRVRNVQGLRAIFGVFRLPGLGPAAVRCRIEAPPSSVG